MKHIQSTPTPTEFLRRLLLLLRRVRGPAFADEHAPALLDADDPEMLALEWIAQAPPPAPRQLRLRLSPRCSPFPSADRDLHEVMR